MPLVSGLSWRNQAAIVTILLVFLSEGINYSQPAPFFPNEAELKKGLSKSAVGTINSLFDWAIVVSCILLLPVASPGLVKLLFVSGAVLAAVANICFGVLTYAPGGLAFALPSAACRITMGMGAALVWSAGIAWVTTLAPARYSGRLVSIAEAAGGLGSVLGPSIGSAVFNLGGYLFPFLASGVLELIIVAFALVVLPGGSSTQKNSYKKLSSNSSGGSLEGFIENIEHRDNSSGSDQSDVQLLVPGNEDDSEDTLDTLKFFLYSPAVWSSTALFALGTVNYSMLNVILSPFLLDTFGVDGHTAGFFFLAQAAFYSISCQLVGYLIDSGFGSYAFFWCCMGAPLQSFLFYLPSLLPFLETRPYIVCVLALNGTVMSGLIAPVFMVLQNIPLRAGSKHPPEATKLVVSIWVNCSLAAGRILGSALFGGFVYEKFGFYQTFLWTSVVISVSCAINGLHFLINGNYTKMNSNQQYTEDGE